MMKAEIIDYCNSNENFKNILELFKDDFLSDFEDKEPKDRTPIMKALPYLYRMWYYSTLVNDSPLSPANFISLQVREKFGEDTLVVPVSSPVYKSRKLKDFKYEYLLISIDDHPVLKDLRLFIDECTPDIGTDENGLLLEEERDRFINSLSFKEIYYVTFLTNTAFELDLLKKLPSIHAYRAVPNVAKVDTFFNLSKEEQLKKIVEATISIASKYLNQTFTFDRKTFSKENLNSLFTDAADLDKFLGYILKKFNLNIEDFSLEDFEFDSENPEQINIPEDILMSLALKLDLSFFIEANLITPLGYYLQLIQPIYMEPMYFEPHFNELVQGFNTPGFPLIKLYFIMSNGFDLTSMGKKLLLDGNSPEHEFQKLTGTIDFSELYEYILDARELEEFHDDYGFEENEFSTDPQDEFAFDKEVSNILDLVNFIPKQAKKKMDTSSDPNNENKQSAVAKNMAYTFKVKYFHNKRCWQAIQLKGTQTLDDLAMAVVEFFELGDDHLYSFFMSNKPYDKATEITCPYGVNTSKITTKYKLHEMGFYPKQKFMFLYDFGDDITFEIEFIDVSPLEKNVKYPIIKNCSKNYKN
jgi:hypothetical protein